MTDLVVLAERGVEFEIEPALAGLAAAVHSRPGFADGDADEEKLFPHGIEL